jgi:hypothetical protein
VLGPGLCRNRAIQRAAMARRGSTPRGRRGRGCRAPRAPVAAR